MSMLRRFVLALRTWFAGARLDRDLDEELRAYVEALTERYVQRGLKPDDARRAALLEVGGIEQVKEVVRDGRIGFGVETLLRDLRYGLRVLTRTPGFALAVVLILALGIGATVTMFSIIHAVLWRPLPYPEAERLVLLDAEVRGIAGAGLTPGEVRELREQSVTLEYVSTIVGVDANLTIDGEMEHVAAASATDDALRLLGGAPPAHGRALEAHVDAGASAVLSVVISDGLWRRRFGANPTAVGRRIQVNNLDVQVVGVLPPGFRVLLPASANTPEEVDVWFPRGLAATEAFRSPVTVARLAAGATLTEAQAELDALVPRWLASHPDTYRDGVPTLSVRSLQGVLTSDVRPALFVLGAGVFFVLLIGCVNVANLMLARASERASELAVRRALGASRLRLVRQLLTEHLVLAALGGACGLLAAYGGVALVEWLRPAHLPRESEIAVDGTVALFAVALSTGVGLAFGLWPAMRLTEDQGHERLRVGRSGALLPRTRRLQRGLVVAEVALSIVPLVAAGLMLRTFVNLTNVPLGFEPTRVVTAYMQYSFRAFPELDQRWPLQREAVERLRQMPGIESASAGGPLPFGRSRPTRLVGRADAGAAPERRAFLQTVLPGYLQVMGIGLLAGRDLTDDDVTGQRAVVLVDDRLAQQLWPEGAVGQHLIIERGRSTDRLEIVGVTNPVRVTAVRDDAMPLVFVPLHFYPIQLSLVMKTDQGAAALAPAIRHAVESLGTLRPVTEIRPMQNYVDRSMGDTRFTMLLLVGFAGAALFLAAFGLYATLAYLVSQRRQEFGVRLALGASASRIARMILAEAGALATVGALIGFAGAGAATSVLAGLLYQVEPLDTVTLAGAAGVVALVALLAAGGPAWRAAQVNPSTALRAE